MFKFRLSPLLRFRKTQEEEKQRELALVVSELMGRKEELDELRSQRSEAASSVTRLGEGEHGVNLFLLYDNYLRGRDGDIHKKKEEIDAVSGKADEKREELIEYVRRRRSLESYRERLLQRYQKEESRKERLESDEVATQMWFRESVW